MLGKKKRFKVLHEEGAINITKILQDTVTGVNYMYHSSGSSGGLTPLLDKNGQVVVTTLGDDYED